MHPRQASVLAQAQEILKSALQALLWKYEDPEGNVFYMEEKRTTVKSPFSGKTFTSHPHKFTPAQVGQEMKEEMKGGKEEWGDPDTLKSASKPFVNPFEE
jgi:hypothetical protein